MDMMKAATSLVPKKFRTAREKGGHRRKGSAENGTKVKVFTTDSWLSIFRPESAKQAQKEKEESEKEEAKIDVISKRLEELNHHEISKDKEVIRLALRSRYAAGDTDKAVELIQLQQQAFSGVIQPYDPNVKMLGAENRGNVTCYLDSLLFAMFAHMTAFESMLKHDVGTEPQRRLAALLRLWVNMLRSGKLIHTDMTELIQQALAECGWKEAALLEQQDTSEAFAFIADVLQLPLLALQMDLFHQGKGDVDDHKVVHERCLNLPVPPDTEGKGIKLEDCMEAYFNNRVDVLRDSLEEKASVDRLPHSPKSTIRVVYEDDDNEAEVEGSSTQENGDAPAHMRRRWTTHGAITHSPTASSHSDSALSSGSRARSTSIIQRIVVNDKQNGESSTDAETRSLIERVKRTGSSMVKAVTIPAWQFYRLIPWNATSPNAPKSDLEVAQHFDQRPVVAICLKRYTISDKGVPIRVNTYIDIPDSLRLPHFMVVDGENGQDPNGLSQGYKLVLQSVICHRGDSIHSGHYVAYARVAPKLLTENRRHDRDPPPDYEEPTWVKFDDLLVDKRVEPVDDIQECLRRQEEMPYVLIYQIVPMVDVTVASTDGSATEPPGYAESTSNIPGTPSVDAFDTGRLSKSPSGYLDSLQTLTNNTGPHIRLSSEVERPSRSSFGDDPSCNGTHDDASRRTSITFSEPPNHPNHLAPNSETASPALTPTVTPQEESTAARLSRAAAKFKGGSSKSRPTSQVGENRISLTISRFGFGRQSRDGGSSGGGGDKANSEGVISEDTAADDTGKEKDKDHHHHFHHHHHQHHASSGAASTSGNSSSSGSDNIKENDKKESDKKDKKEKSRNRSKTRDKEEGNNSKKEWTAFKSKGKGKEAGKDGVPDRECVVM
ncbi:hypothetical protein VTJ04DRAFT_2790 [Mycothermus thermophilus]|uniref:uncharacterized protein n=1 Tax=Humicola insolens TaxID=85995 RepID=UPI003742272A